MLPTGPRTHDQVSKGQETGLRITESWPCQGRVFPTEPIGLPSAHSSELRKSSKPHPSSALKRKCLSLLRLMGRMLNHDVLFPVSPDTGFLRSRPHSLEVLTHPRPL